jgi:plastocyanin
VDSESHQQFFWFLIILILSLFGGAVFIFSKNLPKGQQANLDEPKNYVSRIYTVFYTNGVFSPTNLQINVGDTVRFMNDSLFPIRVVSEPHPDHNDLPGFDSISDISSQGVFTFTFIKRGIFDYHNEKRIEQKGTIIVK